MAALTTALLVGSLAATAAGTAISLVGQSKQTAAMQKAEAARKRQMDLDAMRQRREIARQAVIQRSQALFSAGSQGALLGSGLQGGFAAITGQTVRNTVSTNQNQELGTNIFKANQDYYTASGMTSFGSGLSSLGGAVLSNIGTIDRVGTYVANRPKNGGLY